MTRRFSQLDVFTATPLRGNPLAVVHDADGLSDEQMADFARWTNLSETTFLLAPTRPDADYRVRIFTPGGELPFAGHPTLGSSHAWLAAGGEPHQDGVVVQECGVGLVRVRRDGSRLAFAAPPLLRSGRVEGAVRDHALTALRLTNGAVRDVVWVDNGTGWLAAVLPDALSVLALRPDLVAMGDLKIGAVGPYAAGSELAFEVRAFAPGIGVPEDPVTGSLNAGLAVWMMAAGLAPERYVASQGAALRRAGRVHVARDGQDTWIGGDVTAVISGTIQP